jgi:hypothetical protein
VVVGVSGGGGSSDPTGLGTKIKRKGKKNRKKEKERAALPRSGLFGSRSRVRAGGAALTWAGNGSVSSGRGGFCFLWKFLGEEAFVLYFISRHL